MAVTIDGEYRELPFHKLSVGHTRDGKLLGDSYDYVLSVECREDKEASDYVQICTLSMEEIPVSYTPLDVYKRQEWHIV